LTPYSTILFDLDGTLTDPKVGITKSVQYALSKLGIHEPDLDKVTCFIGPPLGLMFQQAYHVSPSDTRRAVDHYREYFKTDGMYGNVLYDGIPRLLEMLKREFVNLVVATSKPTVFAKKILHHFDIEQYFDHVVGSNLDGTRSAKTEIIECAMRLYPDLATTGFVMIGDREHDIIGANGNDIDSIGVLYGYGTREEFNQAKATYVVDSVEDLCELLSRSI